MKKLMALLMALNISCGDGTDKSNLEAQRQGKECPNEDTFEVNRGCKKFDKKIESKIAFLDSDGNKPLQGTVYYTLLPDDMVTFRTVVKDGKKTILNVFSKPMKLTGGLRASREVVKGKHKAKGVNLQSLSFVKLAQDKVLVALYFEGTIHTKYTGDVGKILYLSNL